MKKGISPVVATVLLISIAVVAGITIYWWATGFQIQPSGKPDEPFKIDVVALNWTTGNMSIRNVDHRDMPATTIYIAQNESRSCNVPALTAGSSTTCDFGSGMTGQLTFMGKKVEHVTIFH